MAAHHSRLSPACSTDPSSRREPPEILVSALAALLSVVAAVCLLAVTHELWALLVAVAVMLTATLLLTFVIGLQLGQSEQPARARRRSRAVRPPADDIAAPDRRPAPAPAEPDGAAATASTTSAAAESAQRRDVADAMAVPTPQRSDPGTGSRLLFVVAAAVADVDELPAAVRAVIDIAADVYVVTPTLPGRLAWLADDVDRCRHVADARLDTVLGHMRSIGAHATGAAVRGSVPTVIADAVARFCPDQILLALHSPEQANWQEHGLIAHVEQRFGLPVTTYAVDSRGHTTAAAGPLVLCYDATESAARAIRVAGGLFAPRRAFVVTVWQATALGGTTWAGLSDSPVDFFEFDRAAAEHGGRVASGGVRIAREAGLDAEPLAIEATGPVWRTIVEIADRHGAEAIVLGSSGLSGVRSLLHERIAGAVAQHAERPTLVIR
jgi:nucleotide-binding universal stress UspA family protein